MFKWIGAHKPSLVNLLALHRFYMIKFSYRKKVSYLVYQNIDLGKAEFALHLV